MIFNLKTSMLVFYIGLSSAIINPALTFAPVLLGGMIEASGFSTSSAVMILSLELLATAGAFLPALWWVANISWRNVATVALVAVTLGNFLSGFCDTVFSLLLVRALTGVFEGTLLILYLLVIAQVTKTERLFGSKLAIQMLVAVIGLILIPYMIGLGGVPSVYFGLALITAILLFAVKILPNQKQQLVNNYKIDNHLKLAGFGCLLLMLIFAAAINMIWTYLERIGTSNGLPLETIGWILAAGVFVAIICGLYCAVIGKRFGRLVPLCLALLAGILGCLLLLNEASPVYFIVGVFLVSIARVIPLPYLFGCLAVLDVNKRLTIFSHVVLSLGMATGPALVILMTGEIDYDRILWFGVLSMGICLLAVFKLTTVVSKVESTF